MPLAEAKILRDRIDRYFAVTCRPMAMNFPIRINNQTYWESKSDLLAILEVSGYTVVKEMGKDETK